ncbi:MAG: 2-hydroxyglutaryl-CoA dehydratase [Clostridiales bacterium]|jgi:predicted CoA-substrate-specific enzyme activase|nr:2-hydroxyglutaryl-CoA dehydratase [Clostridiales bacterium]
MELRLGIDVGSTTVKLVLMDESGEIVYSKYERHMSNVFEKAGELIRELRDVKGNLSVRPVITGSGGLSLADLFGIKFEQEVIACSKAVEEIIPQTDVAIELGGEDAKITFYGQTVEQRMNGTCAGGTGAFIDQMAVLLNTDASGLNEAAKEHTIIYPIASRCGVFAKTDIQPLINDGAKTADIAASIFQAVVNQMISGLACGHPIKGNVAFLGGPLEYLSELRARFIETLDLREEDIVFPDNAKYFVAIGAAYLADKEEPVDLSTLISKLDNSSPDDISDTKYLRPLFMDDAELREFRERHDKDKIKRGDLSTARGPVFLGIDAGSTTTKAALINRDKELLYEHYSNNEGDPLEVVRQVLKEIYSQLPADAYIGRSVVTGYGEGLVQAAYRIDDGEIETMAHYKAARQFLPEVSFILDIGGQDMKCMQIHDGAISSIMLNEACSSGCGSFIETYAKSVNMSVPEFAAEALKSQKPVDLGTRCTVFMNSKVKQAQKEGSSIADISAGLSYSVIKNALYKVIKLRNPSDTGPNVVVQGGTFLNEAVLRSLEIILDKNVIRPDISGLMGAFGSAIIACDDYKEGERSSVLPLDKVDSFSVTTSNARCGRCGNNCLLTISKFADGSRYITGNRCEKGAGITSTKSDLPNLYKTKMKLLFDRPVLSDMKAKRGVIGIPRVLNMYENYPFWHAFFTHLGFRIVLSPPTNKKIYQSGMDTISSDTACYPAKVVHGHIKWLVENGVKRIFYPSINYEAVEDSSAPNHYNCPVVATYPEVIDKNMADYFYYNDVEFYHPFVPYDNDERFVTEMTKFFSGTRDVDVSNAENVVESYHLGNDEREYSLFGINTDMTEITHALAAGREAQKEYKRKVAEAGNDAIRYMREHGKKGIILSGRPYHVDPEINHGIDDLITQQDMVVLSEDSVSWKIKAARPVRILDQWVYHSRLYKAAIYAGQNDDIEVIQLNSFGCGLDAVTTDEVDELLQQNNKLYTVLKIDEGANLGAAKIRIRSLKAALEERDKLGTKPNRINIPYVREIFTKKMRMEGYTLLIPQMSPIHFQYFEPILRKAGYNAVLLPAVTKESEEEGLRYVNNDACYPTIVTLGQIIYALKSGEYDLDKTAVFMSQTGGGCRASNYVALLRKALKDLGMEQVPVISFNMVGLEKNPGFRITVGLLRKMVYGLLYGDLMMKCLYRVRPYEQEKGSAQALMDSWFDRIVENCINLNKRTFIRNLNDIVKDFDALPIHEDMVKPRVGVVGEILVKYHPNANNNLVETIEEEGGEAVVPSFIDFFEYGFLNKIYNYNNLSGTYKEMLINRAGIQFVEHYRKYVREACAASRRFTPDHKIEETATNAERFISVGNQCGEGWLLTGEMVDLIDDGVKNILCLQPFACLPNHVAGKGMLKALRQYDEKANIVAIDYDPGASTVNQLNRIKLMMSTAFKNLED